MSTLDIAREYQAAGFNPIPICNDGSKKPTIDWADLQARAMTEQECQRHFSNGNGIGIICGSISGNLEVLDIDDAELTEPFRAEVELLCPGLIAKLPHVKTPRGDHFYFRCMTNSGNLKLARRAKSDPLFSKKPTLIETRGQGGYVLAPGCPPGCNTDGIYEHVAGPPITEPPTISPAERQAIFQAARTFNRFVDDVGQTPANPRQPNGGLAPGDDFNARASWEEILEPHGWERIHSRGDTTHWKRPGKDERGTSATTGLKSSSGNELLCVFSSNAYPFEIPDGKTCGTYHKFGAFATLNHGGDFGKAAKALAAKGYGEKSQRQTGANGSSPSRSAPDQNDQQSADDRDKFTIERISSREFDSGDYTQSYLIDNILAEGQQLVIAAQLKTLKTTIAVAMGVALALGREFLGRFHVREAVNVLLISGESGLSTLQSAGRRIAQSYGHQLGDVGRLFWSTNLPRLGTCEHIEALREALVGDEIHVLICDPLYFMLPGQDAGNLMIVGGYLRQLSALCDECGVTLVIVHHCKRNGIDKKNDPPELSHISWSGTAEWARQWLLLSRRKDYVAGTGEHLLWMVTGGSAGHSGLHGLNVYEGVGDERTWHVDVLEPDDLRRRQDEAAENAAEAKVKVKLERDKKAIVSAMLKMPEQQGTKSDIRERTGRNGQAFNLAFADLIANNDLQSCELTKANGQAYPGFRLVTADE